MVKLSKYSKKCNIYSCILEAKKLKKNKIEFTNEEIFNIYDSILKENHIVEDVERKVNDFIENCINKNNFELNKKNCFNKDFLISELENSKISITIKELAEKHRSKYPKLIFSDNNLKSFIKRSLKFRYKVTSFNNIKSVDKESDQMHLLFAKRITSLMTQEHQLMYMDESHFKEERSNKRRWIRKNAQKIPINTSRFGSFSVIGLFSEYGLLNYRIFENAIVGEDVVNFFKESQHIIEFNNSLYSDLNKERVTIILDNSKTHVKKSNISEYKKMKFNFLFQPSYSPSNNASEYCWNIIKTAKRRRTFYSK